MDIEISKMIEIGFAGDLCFNAASLYPLLYRLEQRGWIEGRRMEKPNQRKRRYYRITTGGRKIPREKRSTWHALVTAVNRITGVENA